MKRKLKPFSMLALLALVFIVGIAESSMAAEKFSQQLIRVTSYIQQPDIDAPWRTLPIREEVHMGIVLDRHHVLVSAYAVAHARNFEYQAIGSSDRQELQLGIVDYNTNLALLKSSADLFSLGFQAMKLGQDLRLGDEASVLTARDGQRLISFPMRVREVLVQSAMFSPYLLPHYAFDTQKRAAGWSEPIVKNDLLVGITISKRDETVFAMPVSVVRRFYDEAVSSEYRGLTRLGFGFEPLTSPELRAYAGLSPQQRGVWISRIQDNSPLAGRMREGDVLLRFDNLTINDQGLFQHPQWGRISFAGALYRYRAGDQIRIDFARDGQEQSIQVELPVFEPLNELIPWDVPRDEPYLIFGGALFQELSLAYLKKWGRDWRERAPIYFLKLWNFDNQPQFEGHERIVILSQVLADSLNRGYENLQNLQLMRVNGQAVRSLEHLRGILAQLSREDFVVFELAPGRQTIILRFDDLVEAHQRIARNYGVQDEAGFFVMGEGVVEAEPGVQ